jgi:siroheme synthase (precorrin-2 oxidase/ferrochelatase)
MSNPVIHAFFVGRALAEVIKEKIEDNITNALSELGKFDAEQREHLRQFLEEVNARAAQEAAKGIHNDRSSVSGETNSVVDLQEIIDELRAEIAHLRIELKQYRQSST